MKVATGEHFGHSDCGSDRATGRPRRARALGHRAGAGPDRRRRREGGNCPETRQALGGSKAPTFAPAPDALVNIVPDKQKADVVAALGRRLEDSDATGTGPRLEGAPRYRPCAPRASAIVIPALAARLDDPDPQLCG